MQVCVLGPVEVRSGDRAIAVSGARVRRLLVRLAVDAARPVATGELEEVVWFDGDVPPEAANALQSLFSRLRRALGDARLVEQVPTGYRLGLCTTDLAEFDHAARVGRAALASGDMDAAARELRAALQIWRGDPLAGRSARVRSRVQ
jgi:DNA-binding SARP family transcriptional activator